MPRLTGVTNTWIRKTSTPGEDSGLEFAINNGAARLAGHLAGEQAPVQSREHIASGDLHRLALQNGLERDQKEDAQYDDNGGYDRGDGHRHRGHRVSGVGILLHIRHLQGVQGAGELQVGDVPGDEGDVRGGAQHGDVGDDL